MAPSAVVLAFAALLRGTQAGVAVTSNLASHAQAPAAPMHVVSPPVTKSHDKFFGRDYPHDAQPKNIPDAQFDHPYPTVQEADVYDKDYPKDENKDDGEWEAQHGYDVARSTLASKTAAAERARKEKAAADKELEAAKRADASVGEVLRKAQAIEADAKHDADQAEEEGDDEGPVTEADKEVADALKEVKLKAKDLVGCEKNLVDAKARLDKVLEAYDDEEQQRIRQVVHARESLVNATKQLKTAEKDRVKYQERRKVLEERLANQKKADIESTKALERDSKQLQQAEDESRKATESLRQFRPLPEVRSGASRSSFLLALVAAVLAPLAALALL